MSDNRPEASFAGCPKCGELLHLHHLEWVKALTDARDEAEGANILNRNALRAATERIERLEKALRECIDAHKARSPRMIGEAADRAAAALSPQEPA